MVDGKGELGLMIPDKEKKMLIKKFENLRREMTKYSHVVITPLRAFKVAH